MTEPLLIGSLFSGTGGLDHGVAQALAAYGIPTEVAWYCDIEPGPSKLLAHHWPGVPNLHDITTVDWNAVPRVRIITGGSPCQDLSHAGKGAGMRPGTRSGLWASMCDAIQVQRPDLVVWENVRGALSAAADSNVEPCPICVGDDGDVHLRALGRVLGDLAELGYDASWVGLRASDAGAPHARFRVFVFAWPAADPGHATVDGERARPGSRVGDPGTAADAGVLGRLGRPGVLGAGRDQALGGEESHHPRDGHRAHPAVPHPDDLGREGAGGARRGVPGPADGRQPAPDADGAGRVVERAAVTAGEEHPAPQRGGDAPAADPEGDGRHEGRPEPTGLERGPDAALGGDAAAADADGRRAQRRRGPGAVGDQAAGREGHGGERERDGDALGHRGAPAAVWGEYAPAVQRWESVLGRAAPAATELGRTGNPRLSPRFVEWLMGLDAGHVTSVPGLSRNEQLKLLGNGVVPQQAALALHATGAAERLAEALR